MAEDEKKTKKEKRKENFGFDLEEMAGAGLHLGHKASKTHPKMKPYIFGVRNTICVIDLERSAEKLKEALEFIQKLISENKKILFVGTKVQFKDLIKEIAKECGLPYINERWLGGTLTNFGTIKKRIEYFKELEEKKKAGKFAKYTKKERAKLEKELRELEERLGGIKNLEKLPDAVFIVGLDKDQLAAREANKKGIPVIGVCDTNIDPTLVDYFIPANDDAISSVRYILEKIKEVVIKNKTKTK